MTRKNENGKETETRNRLCMWNERIIAFGIFRITTQRNVEWGNCRIVWTSWSSISGARLDVIALLDFLTLFPPSRVTFSTLWCSTNKRALASSPPRKLPCAQTETFCVVVTICAKNYDPKGVLGQYVSRQDSSDKANLLFNPSCSTWSVGGILSPRSLIRSPWNCT